MDFKNIFLCFLMILGGIATSNAQNWNRIYGPSSNEIGVAGVELANGDFTILCWSGITYLMRIDTDGNLLNRDTIDALQESKMLVLGNGGFALSGKQYNQVFPHPFIRKYDSDSEELWTILLDNSIVSDGVLLQMVETSELVELEDGSMFLMVRYVGGNFGEAETHLFKIDTNGGVIWDQVFTVDPWFKSIELSASPDGNVLIGFNLESTSNLSKIDTSGNNLWTVGLPGDISARIASTVEGGAVFAETNAQGDIIPDFFYKTDENGTIVDQHDRLDILHDINKLKRLSDGSFLAYGKALSGPQPNMYMQRVFPTTGTTWGFRTYDKFLEQTVYDVIYTSDNRFLLIGYTYNTGGELKIYIIKTDTEGQLANYHVRGNIRYDADLSCTDDPSELGLGGFQIRAEGVDTVYAITDSVGDYTLGLNLGNYTIRAYAPNDLWSFCEEEYTVELSELFGDTIINFQAQPIVDCPYLEVDISTIGLRRCFENRYYVSYSNVGTEMAEEASVEVVLDDFMTVDATSIPYSSNVGNLYIFDVGDLEIGGYGSFTIDFTLDENCESTILGETHCVETRIFPQEYCMTDPLWSGATVEVSAECGSDSLTFFITNTGVGNMAGPLPYIIIEDEVVLREGIFELDAGEMILEKVPANGSTYVLRANQEPNHPSDVDIVSVFVEGCGVNDMAEISLGFINLYPDSDDDPFVSIDCRINVGSFDPNDKQAFPIGYGDEHFIDQNESIEYMIRFQNTGTDTAFTVVVLDTLSELLNPLTIQLGASSHPYRFSIQEDGVLSFLFENIMLPDSNVNQVASNGFLKFTVDQVVDNPIGTEIFNTADIYFDFNDPVVTNTTWHTVGEDYVIVLSDQKVFLPEVEVDVYPNPFTEEAVFELKGIQGQGLSLNVYNAIGQFVRSESFENNRVLFQRDDLTTGVYFYNISNESQIIANGKIVVH